MKTLDLLTCLISAPQAIALLLFFCVAVGAAQELPDSLISPVDAAMIRKAERPDSTVLRPKSPKGAMLRSIFVPGWGQFYNGKWFKGLVIAGAEVGLAANAVIQNQLAVQSRDLYERAFYEDNRSLSIWWLAGVILYSMADAYVDAHLHGFDVSPGLNLDNGLGISNRQTSKTALGLSLAVRF